MTVNVLALVHGITPEARPEAHTKLYADFWRALQRAEPSLERDVARVVYVEWGNRVAGVPDRPDTRLSEAERRAGQLASFEHVERHPGPNNVLLPGLFGDWPKLPGVRELVFRPLREQLVQLGLADAVYYASADGERAVRVAVYGQVLAALRPHRDDDDVRLHLVGHSLGVTVCHDLLYGLFGKKADPDFLGQAATPEDRDDYEHWRRRAGGALRVGSFVSLASQLPLFALRKQALVDRLAAGGTLDPSDIGIAREGRVRWLVCYDVDDVLGFATRELYGDAPSMRQVQVDAGDFPLSAHTDYWTCARVIEEAAALIAATAG